MLPFSLRAQASGVRGGRIDPRGARADVVLDRRPRDRSTLRLPQPHTSDRALGYGIVALSGLECQNLQECRVLTYY